MKKNNFEEEVEEWRITELGICMKTKTRKDNQQTKILNNTHVNGILALRPPLPPYPHPIHRGTSWVQYCATFFKNESPFYSLKCAASHLTNQLFRRHKCTRARTHKRSSLRVTILGKPDSSNVTPCRSPPLVTKDPLHFQKSECQPRFEFLT